MRTGRLLSLFLFLICSCGCVIKSGKQVRKEITPLYSASSPEFRQAAGSLLGPNFVTGNNITTLVNGKEIFPAMLSAIRSAKRSITFETYVYEKGDIAREFTEALAERARSGVKVHAMLDAHGTRPMGNEKFDETEASRSASGEIPLHFLARSPPL